MLKTALISMVALSAASMAQASDLAAESQSLAAAGWQAYGHIAPSGPSFDDNVDQLVGRLRLVPRVASYGAKFVVLIETAAQDCHFAVDAKEVHRTMLTFAQMDYAYGVQFLGEMHRVRISGSDNALTDFWSAMVGKDRASACHVASNLWGEYGALWPGLLVTGDGK